MGTWDFLEYLELRIFVSETYHVEDNIRYDKCDTNKISNYTFEEFVNSGVTQTLSFDTDNYKVELPENNNGSAYHIPLVTHDSNTKMELSAIMKTGNSNTTAPLLNADCGFGLVDVTNHKSNFLYYRYINGNQKAVKRYSKQTAISTQSHTYNQEATPNQNNNYLKHKLTVDGLSFTYKVTDLSDNTLWEYTNTFDSDLTGKQLGIITSWNNCTAHIKEIKVKPL